MKQQKFYWSRISLLMIFGLFFGLHQVKAQQLTVVGRVTDESGAGMPGASVHVEGTTTGANTNKDGLYTIVVPNPNATLVFSYISYTTQNIKVNGQKTIDVQLIPDIKLLDEVVCIGYQTVTRRKVAAAVASISGEKLKSIPAASLDVMLQGRLSGVNVQNFSGEPGSRQSITIRGNTAISRGDEFYASNDPLYVIDGVATDTRTASNFSTSNSNFIAGLNPSDIESIDVLKDASASAIYGSRAANGVVLITTKRGKSGKTQVSYNGFFGFIQSPTLPNIYVGAEERRRKLEDIYLNGTYYQVRKNPLILTDSLNPAFNNNTDWYGLFYQNGILQSHDLSVTGGTDKNNYRVSAGYYDEQGTIKGNGMKRYTFSSRIFNNVGNWMELNTNFYYSLIKRNPATGGASRNVTSLDPAKFPSSLLYLSDADKKLYLGLNDDSRDDNSENNFTVSNDALIKISKAFNFRNNISYTSNGSSRDQFIPSTTNVAQIASASSLNSTYNKIAIENLFNYMGKYNNHLVMVTLGQSAEKEKQSGSSLYGNFIPTDQINTVNGVTSMNMSGSSTQNEAGLLSYFTRASYFYKDRYNLSLSFRADGSSRFGPDTRWGHFPSASVFWIISDEPFAEGLKKTVDMIKIRASYGITGSQPGDYYGYYNKYNIKGWFPGASGNTNSYNGISSIGPNWDGIAQDNLTWEEARQWNIGVDVELLKNRFVMALDIYNRENHGIRFDFPMPVTSGYNTYYTNAADIRNAGAEFSIQARILPPANKLQWNINFNISKNKNTIIKLPDNNKPIQVGEWMLVTGQPLNQYFMFNYEGVYKTEDEIPVDPLTGKKMVNLWGNAFTVGDSKYEDVDGDYIFNPYSYGDRKLMGDPNPKFVGGFANDFFYGNWSLGIQCSFVLGRDIYNASLAQSLDNGAYGADEEGNGFSTNYQTQGAFSTLYNNGHFYGIEDFIARRALLDMSGMSIWRPNDPNNSNAEYPTTAYAEQYNYVNFSSMFIEDGSYLKVNRITLGYNFTSSKLAKFGIEHLRVHIAGENLRVFKNKNTRASDPELVDAKGFYTGTMYALGKKFTAGLEVSFK